MQPDVKVQASVVTTGNVTLTDRDTITSLTYGGSLTKGNGDSIGTSTKAALTNATRSTSVVFPAASQSIILNSGQSMTPSPGSYVSLTVNSGATLTLLAGDYYFGTFDLRSSSVLKLSPTQGATRIFISSTFVYQPTLGSGADAARLLVEYFGTNPVVLETPFLGSIVAPDAYLAIATANSRTHRGSFMAQSLEVQPNAKLEFVAFNPSGTTSSCAAGTWDPDGNPFTPCVAKTTCAPGSRVSNEGTTTSDRSCSACTSGQFSNVNNAPSCTAWTTCQAGTYVSNTPSSTVDRVCVACPSGQYSSGNNQSHCLDQGSCVAGTVQTTAGTPTSPAVCTPCVAGQYCAGGTSPQTTCVSGTWDHDGNPATACAAKTTCLAGTYVTNEGATTTDRTCAACASGSYSPSSNAVSCTTWTTCLAGSYVTNSPSVTEDRTCAACPAGQYSASNNQTSCQAQGTCPAGTVQTGSGTSTSATICTACVAGQYCPGGDAEPVACASSTWDHDLSAATPCVAKTTCLPGTFVGTEGSATSDRACLACASGSLSTATNAAACAPWSNCPAGTFVGNTPSSTVDRVCTSCPDGQYSSGSNQSQCQDQGSCAAGTVQIAAGTPTSAAVCQSCEAGQYCAGGTSPATACGDGTWDSDGNPATACASVSVCPPGTLVLAEATATSDRTCQACDAGTFSTSANAFSCTAWATCDVGTYVSNAPSATADRVCSACETGRYSSTQNAPACTVWATCSAGSYMSNTPSATANRECTPCQAGQYSSGDNQSSCLPQGECTAGTVTVTPGSSTSAAVCQACVAGEYCAGGTGPEIACASGTWDQDGDPATACVDKSICPAGTFLASEGSTTTDRSCTTCGNEQFSTASNSATCTAWVTCSAGTFVSNTPSTTTDRVCTQCGSSTFSSASNAAACTPASVCSAGTFVSTQANASSDAVCSECAPGSYSTTTNASACQPCACNDGLACTTGSCNAVGTCTYSPNPGSCVIDGACHADGAANPANGCQICNPSSSQSAWSLAPTGTSCDDGNACTSNDVCTAGACAGTARLCDDGLACTTDSCKGDGTCTFTPTAGNCAIAGACYPSGAEDPGNQCQQCLPSVSQTVWSPKANGTSCNDGIACTANDICTAGVCGGTTQTCDDGLACTSDRCNGDGTCTFSPNAESCVIAGVCYATGATNPANQCETCAPGASQTSWTSKSTGTTCNDGNPCTQTDTCVAGSCVGANPKTCTALDQCHEAGTCDSGTGACSNPAKSDGATCSDGNACTRTDTCLAGTCTGGNPVVCTASNQCHDIGVCNTSTGVCTNPSKANGVACNDGNACTRTDTCQSGNCTGSNSVVCTALDQCHTAGTCNASTGVCTNPNKPDGTGCNDGSLCTQMDTCSAGACVGSNPVVCGAGNACQNQGSCDPPTGLCLYPGKVNGTDCDDGNDGTSSDSCQAGACVGIPALPSPTATNLANSLSHIYQGAGASQAGVAAGTIRSYRAAAISGHVSTSDGAPLMGVKVIVAGHTEFGQSLTRADGGYDLVVNGGSVLTVTLTKSGYLSVDRQMDVPWQGFAHADETVMLPIDSKVTTIDLSQQSQQVAVGSVSSDPDGARQPVVVIPAGTQAMMDLPNGTTVPLTTLSIHITELTVGDTGQKAMPAPLPGNTQYTYAVDYAIDEGIAAGAKAVRFSQPLYHYNENFLGFPVGMGIPAGYYDRNLHAWLPLPNGAVVKMLAIVNDMAQLDVDGTGNPAGADWKQAMGITDAELAYLAQRYQPGQTLWRVPVPHFSFMDYNLSGGPPPGATGPQCSAASAGPSTSPDSACGSIIEVQNQVVGERIPITGTPFTLNYRSNRVEGYKPANLLNIALTGDTLPPSLLNIKVKADIVGHKYEADVSPSANAGYQLVWDGRDGIGRQVNGQQVAQVSVGFEYPLTYYKSTDELYHTAIDFGKLGSTITRTSVAGRAHMISWQDLPVKDRVLGTYLAKSAKLGGWTLDVNHSYDAQHTLWRGDGEREKPLVDRGGSQTVSPPCVMDGYRIALAADGSVYLTGQQSGQSIPAGGLNPGTVRRVDPTTGDYVDFFTLAKVPSAENGPYGAWYQRQILSMATGPDDSLYVSANVWVYAGTAERYIDHITSTGDFIESWKVIDASGSGNIQSMVATNDGSLYYANVRGDGCLRLMKLTRDGQKSQVAGGDCTNPVASGDGGAAINATFKTVSGAVDLALGSDGSIYIANQSECRVRRIGLDGVISTVAGSSCPTPSQHSGDGGAATMAKIIPMSIAVGKDDTLYIGDYDYWHLTCTSCSLGCSCYASGDYGAPRSRIRAVTNGTIDSIAGANVVYGGLGVAPQQLSLGPIYDLLPTQDSLYYVESVGYGCTGKPDRPSAVRRISAPLAGPNGLGTFRVPSKDGLELYEFDGNGVHLRTLDALTSAVRYQLAYTNGQPTTITDASGLVTTIVRNETGVATAIIAPNGQQTQLGYTDDGYLASVDQPGDIHREFTYHDGGLLHTFQNPNGNVSTFSYDDLGQVTSEAMPGGCSWSLTRTGPTAASPKAPVQVNLTSAEGRTRTYTIGKDDSGTENRTNLSSAGLATTTSKTQAAVETDVSPDGMTTTVTSGPDPRGGFQAPIPLSTVVKTPANKQMTVAMSRVATLDSTSQNLVTQVDTTTVNGKATVSTYNAGAKTITNRSPVGRQTVTTLDDKGRAVQIQAGSLAPTAYAYDTRGRLHIVTVGTGPSARATTFDYDPLDRLQTVTDPLNRTQSYAYDDANRVTTQTFTDGSSVVFGYDANGNVTSVTPPGKPMHGFGFTANDLMSSYTPPPLSTEVPTTYEYNLDKQPTVITRPDGSTINFTYDSAGRLATTTYPSVSGNVTVTRVYSATTGKLTGVATSDGQSLAYGYDGNLVTSTTWSGNVAGTVGKTYNNDFRVASQMVNGANSVSFGYDNDGLLTSVDGLAFTRDPTNGLVTDSTLGQVTDHRTYDSFGALATYEAKFGSTSLYSTAYVRDSLGRIEQKTETIQGTTTVWNYSYDSAGRLWQVMQNGILSATYLYDTNGNRLSKTTTSGAESGTYDAQDRLLTYGKWSCTYTANGDLQTKTDTSNGQVTNYTYDARGNLHHVGLPDGRAIDYVIDSENRRVAKKINGAVVRKWIYEDQLRAAAEFDGAGTLLARYLHGVTIKAGTSYRVIADSLGTPRLLVNSTTGAVAERLDFDEWGQVTADTAVGFQVFGYAHGLYDADTGLVRFGARDYDPVVGRWASRDPILFRGGTTALYGYVVSDPVNRIDRTGLGDCGKNDSKDNQPVECSNGGLGCTVCRHADGSVHSASIACWAPGGPLSAGGPSGPAGGPSGPGSGPSSPPAPPGSPPYGTSPDDPEGGFGGETPSKPEPSPVVTGSWLEEDD